MKAYEIDTISQPGGQTLAAEGLLIRTNAGRERNQAAFFQPLYTRRKPVARRDKGGSWLRLMTCLVCSTESVEMLGTGKMTLLTSRVLCVRRRDSWANAPTTPYHSDENLTPLNLITVFLAETSCGLCLQFVPTEQHEVLPSVISQGLLDIMRNCLLTY